MKRSKECIDRHENRQLLALLAIGLAVCLAQKSLEISSLFGSSANNSFDTSEYSIVWLSGDHIDDGPYRIPASLPRADFIRSVSGVNPVSTTIPESISWGHDIHIHFANDNTVRLFSCSPALAPFFFRPLPINFAEAQSMTLIPGIGPDLAERIVTERQKHGVFISPDDLLRVQGIGAKKSESLSQSVSFQTSCDDRKTGNLF